MAPSTSATPLVARSKRHKPSWFTRYLMDPITQFDPAAIFNSSRRAAHLPRSVFVNEPLPPDFYNKKGKPNKEHVYASNQNVTSKYTIITFLPRNLLEQFRRVANIFFLGIAILQFFSKFSTISPGLVILPLLVVLAITAGKDAYEDINRHQADHKVNHSIVHTLGGQGFENPNLMTAKSKTFVPAIPLPKRKSKKAKKAEQEAQVGAGVVGGDRTTADAPPPTAQPEGQGLNRVRSQVSNWEEDPEAGDTPAEIGWHNTIWEDVKVGDIVKIYDNEQFPADIIICATSEEEDVCYIETKNLDGETNLKSRHAVTGLAELGTAEACAQTRLRIDLDAPEVNMFRLNGAVIKLDEEGDGGEPEIHPITLETTLLRGCILKNTAWVIGIVAFTGVDTKIVQNSGLTPSKRSRVERQMNPQVLVNLLVLGLICMVCAIVDHFNERRWVRQGTYWTYKDDRSGDNPNVNGIVTFANALITFQNIVPISLYISIEFVRTIQAAFIYWDPYIRYIKDGIKTRTLARTWNLSDDLGQIEYVFSDKTGTLTQNAMIFRQCSVGGKIYTGDGQTPDGILTDDKKPDDIHSRPHPRTQIHSGHRPMSQSDLGPSDSDSSATQRQGEKSDDVKVALPKEVLAPFHDANLDRDLEDHESEQSRILHGFFAVLGLCHTVLAAEPEPGVIEYKAQSPDEAALVQSAADVGFVFRGRDKNTLRLSTPFSDQVDEYELLNVLEFNSARKRMSVIVRKMDADGRLFLLCKGADNVIFERLVKDNSQRELREKTDQDLQHFASEGLRTLCLAYRVLNPIEYEKWAAAYHAATVSLDDREAKVEEVSGLIEQNLILLGATAIEDKLQDGVPETIADLTRAGIKVWVATGDKLETAVAIGYTTNLLTKDTNLIIVRQGNHTVHDQIRDALEGFFDGAGLHRTHTTASLGSSHDLYTPGEPGRLARVNTGVQSLVGQDNGNRPGGFSLVIEGGALANAFDDPETADLLLTLSTKCTTVVCCRVSPLQKAQIVHLIKDNLGVICLAIGDGANDVSMIQAADVGVGISGEEGLQAVNSSDYAIAQFRYLKRLLFVHGHWSYFRNSSMILNFFYKNIINIGVLFWFQIYCGWSSTYVMSYTYLLFWNVFWTIAPVIAIGLFDRNIDSDILMAIPELYRYSRESKYFGIWRFTYYIFEAVYQSAVVFFFLLYAYITTTTRKDGFQTYIYEGSTTMVIGAVFVANLFSGLNIYAWTWWSVFAISIGPFLVWIYTAVYSVIPPSSFYTTVYGNDFLLFRSYGFWFGWPFVLVIALLPRYLIRTIGQNYLPDDIDTMRLVRKYHPELNVETHPLLGGALKGEDKDVNEEGLTGMSEDRERDRENWEGNQAGSGNENVNGTGERKEITQNSIPMEDIRRKSYVRQSGEGGRPSLTGVRGYGSQVDMSTGLEREPSRGFGFIAEEGGVAMARMQSRLSEVSAHRRPSRFLRGGRKDTPGSPNEKSSTPFGISRIRERAGSILGRKRAGTNASSAEAPSPHGSLPRESRMGGRVTSGLSPGPEEGGGGGGGGFEPPEPPRV
ncbi:hypothetical protein TREMEDRAFT_74105 [Tremella mesenterica DSM 1558]|uniref:uncharacterized protein n=1 Tax=Tremella mesenterica (strain ATCC 24925 / CBS 8224 / DSM 1558 / NBRC 9311 / NRRL Y-6157 / RJB 2259-6 / UBC 559-6) TaxID=578456 RepID=UPI0003F4958D|nr:uncharacterized protein TREMEDRAFT_74105 [Tremella mesenterica DSM 1558]EIW68591.1 hypothetical protein TREMEDRAFT_74105 [Tremella mesenterica DSM 1558]